MSAMTLVDNRFDLTALDAPDAFEIPVAAEVRRCAFPDCRAKLRTSNPGSICSTCERKSRLSVGMRKPPQPAHPDVPLSELRMDSYWHNLGPREKYWILEAAAATLATEARAS